MNGRLVAGVLIYDCPHCAFDSEVRARLEQHMAEVHKPAPLPASLPAVVAAGDLELSEDGEFQPLEGEWQDN